MTVEEPKPKRSRGRPPKNPPKTRWRTRCTATSKSTGEQCKAYAIEGAEVCRMHGGSAPQVRRKAKERKARYDAEAAAAKQIENLAFHVEDGEDGVTDPLDMLQRLAAEIDIYREKLGHLVNNLYGQLTTTNDLGEVKVHPVVDLYERALDRAARIADRMLALDIEGRKVDIAQQQANMVAAVVLRVLVEVGVPAEKMEEAKSRFYQELQREIEK